MVVGQHFHLGLDHFEAVGAARRLDFSVQGHPLTGFEAVFQVGAVEPHAFDLAPQALADGHFENGHAPGAQQSHAPDFADQAGHFARNQLFDCLRTKPVFVAEGQVVQQVLDCADALIVEGLGDARADAFDELKGRFQSQEHISDAISGAGNESFRGPFKPCFGSRSPTLSPTPPHQWPTTADSELLMGTAFRPYV